MSAAKQKLETHAKPKEGGQKGSNDSLAKQDEVGSLRAEAETGKVTSKENVETVVIEKKDINMSEFATSSASLSAAAEATVPKFILLDKLDPDRAKHLECVICSQISVPPIRFCDEGHNICYICHTQAEEDVCSCGAAITSKQNQLAEHIVSELHFKCFDDRCTSGTLLSGKEINGHANNCEYRPVSCQIHNNRDKSGHLSCNGSIPFDEYISHLKEKHNVIGIEGSSTVVNMSTTVKLGQGNWTFPPQYLNAFGKTFLCHFHASFNLIIGWISLCDTTQEAAKYAGSVTIFHPQQKWKQVKWMGQVHSFRSTSEQVYESGNCLILLPETFLLFAQAEPDPMNETKTDEANKLEWNNNDPSKRIKKWTCHFEVSHIHELEKIQQSTANAAENTQVQSSNPEQAGMEPGGTTV